MATHGEKLIFGFLGAMTAIVFGLAVFTDFQKPSDRTPASSHEQRPIEYELYPYFID